MTLHPTSYYALQIRNDLPVHAFHPVRSRLTWLGLHVATVVACMVAVCHGMGGVLGQLGLGLVIGHAFAGMAFVGHETMHGAVVRNRTLRYLVGTICFLPFWLPPRLWVAWHNKVHHGNTMRDGVDPDSFPKLVDFQQSRLLRIADRLSFGGRRILGFFTLLIGFSGQSSQVMWRMARRRDYLSTRNYLLAATEWLLSLGLWVALGCFIGPRAFLFAYVIPLFVANVVVMGYILTNHSLSPLTEVNDPLVNSLSVTLPGVIERIHLNFGLHVEHHLFPAMSSAYAKLVREQLLARWPERYQSLPLFSAIGQLFRSGRVYKSDTILIEPRDGSEQSTLLPRTPPERVEIAPAA